jgi:predicted aconitase with swiveling domain
MTTRSADAIGRMPLSAVPLNAGTASGRVLRLDVPLSFWGGTDHRGVIVDGHHPQRGQSVAGSVLVMRSGRGSSSSSYVLAEQLRVGTGPSAIVLAERDAIITLGTMVAQELYDTDVPVALVDVADLDHFVTGDLVTVACSDSTALIRLGGAGG